MSETKNLKESNKTTIYAVITVLCVVIFLIQLGIEGYFNIKNIYAGLGISGGEIELLNFVVKMNV